MNPLFLRLRVWLAAGPILGLALPGVSSTSLSESLPLSESSSSSLELELELLLSDSGSACFLAAAVDRVVRAVAVAAGPVESWTSGTLR